MVFNVNRVASTLIYRILWILFMIKIKYGMNSHLTDGH